MLWNWNKTILAKLALGEVRTRNKNASLDYEKGFQDGALFVSELMNPSPRAKDQEPNTTGSSDPVYELPLVERVIKNPAKE